MTQKIRIDSDNTGITKLSLTEDLTHGGVCQARIYPNAKLVDIELESDIIALSVTEARILAQAILDATEDYQ